MQVQVTYIIIIQYLYLFYRTSLWKYAITASDNNTEFKIWCCASWECLQTVRFEARDEKPMFFKTEIDPTSSYLVLTDANTRNLYVMQIVQTDDEMKNGDNEAGAVSSTNGATKPLAFIKSITEFPLSSSILSFGIVDATVRKYKCAYNDVYLLEELDDYDDDSVNRYCVVIHLFLVQPKSVQECHVLYQPTLSINADVGSSVSALSEGASNDRDEEEDELTKDLTAMLNLKTGNDGSSSSSMSDTSKAGIRARTLLDCGNEAKKAESIGDKSGSQQSIGKPTSTLNLLTPDSFHSSGKLTPEGVSNEVYSTLRMLAGEKSIDSTTNLLQLVNSSGSANAITNNQSDEADKIPLLKQVSEDSTNDNNNDDNSPEIVPPLPPASMLTTGVSAGSSPSREVQEILSQKGSDCINDFYSNSIDIQDDTDGSGNNGDVVDVNAEEEKTSNQDDEETYTLNNGKSKWNIHSDFGSEFW